MNKEEKKKKILKAFEEINENQRQGIHIMLLNISNQVAGFIEKWKYREDVQRLGRKD